MTFITHHTVSMDEKTQPRRDTPLVIRPEVREHIHLTKGDGCCGYCGDRLEEGKRAIDHMVPWRRGGTNSYSNLMPTCTTCNIQKKDRLVEEFRVWLMLDRRRVRTGAPNFSAEQINWLRSRGFDVFDGLDRVVFHFEKDVSKWLPLPDEYSTIRADAADRGEAA